MNSLPLLTILAVLVVFVSVSIEANKLRFPRACNTDDMMKKARSCNLAEKTITDRKKRELILVEYGKIATFDETSAEDLPDCAAIKESILKRCNYPEKAISGGCNGNDLHTLVISCGLDYKKGAVLDPAGAAVPVDFEQFKKYDCFKNMMVINHLCRLDGKVDEN